MTADPFRSDLVTFVQSLAYDFRTRTGRLTMPDGCCTAMAGCIRLFVAIDPHVVRIDTVSGHVPDTSYHRDERRGWVAVEAVPR